MDTASRGTALKQQKNLATCHRISCYICHHNGMSIFFILPVFGAIHKHIARLHI